MSTLDAVLGGYYGEGCAETAGPLVSIEPSQASGAPGSTASRQVDSGAAFRPGQRLGAPRGEPRAAPVPPRRVCQR
ncbi:MAG: hypothetical protein WCL21_20065 [Mariniphaga sp.]